MMRLPAPAATAGLGHLPRWTFEPIALLEEGARTAPVFSLRLWRTVIVGYRPDWNRAILGDLDTFRSRGSLSGLSPYLSAGVVHTDVPTHNPQRTALNPHFHARAIEPLRAVLRTVIEAEMPEQTFDALAWSHRLVRRMLNAVFFAGRLPDGLLAEFFAPLEHAAPAPLLPRPLLFRRLNAAIARQLADPPVDTLAAALVSNDNAAEEIRVALAAGYDTTAHTLAWALWHLADSPQWREPDLLPAALDEVLRLYPAGWIGSRVCHRDVHVAGVDVAAGSLVMYSPYLTHRDPELWPRPGEFRPQRFVDGKPAWAFIPFSAGRRTCLGAPLARMMLLTALESFCDRPMKQHAGEPAVRTSIALRPAGPLRITR